MDSLHTSMDNLRQTKRFKKWIPCTSRLRTRTDYNTDDIEEDLKKKAGVERM